MLSLSQDQLQQKIICPGPVTCLTASPNGLYVLAGVAESIYLWEVRRCWGARGHADSHPGQSGSVPIPQMSVNPDPGMPQQAKAVLPAARGAAHQSRSGRSSGRGFTLPPSPLLSISSASGVGRCSHEAAAQDLVFLQRFSLVSAVCLCVPRVPADPAVLWPLFCWLITAGLLGITLRSQHTTEQIKAVACPEPGIKPQDASPGELPVPGEV